MSKSSDSMLKTRGDGFVIKTREDFTTEDDYLEYVRTPDFLENYSIVGKTVEQIRSDLRLPKEWIHYVEKAYNEVRARGLVEGMDLFILVDYYVMEDEDYDKVIEEIYERFYAEKQLDDFHDRVV